MIAAPEVVAKLFTMGDALTYVVVIDGQIVGKWRRTLGKEAVIIEINPFKRLTKTQQRAVAAAAQRYGEFLEKHVVMLSSAPRHLTLHTPQATIFSASARAGQTTRPFCIYPPGRWEPLGGSSEKFMRRKNTISSADWNQFRRLMVYLRPHIGRFTIAMIAIVIGSLLGLAGPYTLQFLIDAVFTQDNAQLLNQITVILIIIFALQAVFYFIRAYQLQYIGERVMIDLRLNLFQHLQKLSLSFYNERRTGELVSRATNDVSTVRTLVTSDVSTAISQVIVFFGALILILITDWRLTFFMLALVPLVVIVALLFGRRLRKISSAVQDQLADATTMLEEVLSGVRVVQSFTREDYEIGRYRGSIEQTFALALKRIKLSATFGPVASFMGFTVVIAVFWFGGQQVLNGTLTAGQLTMFLILTLTIAGSIGSFSGLWTSLQEALGATKRIFEILDTPSDIVDRAAAKALPRIDGHIMLDRVSFAYKDNTDQHVLHGVSLEVKPGEVLALVGPSGAGKTTLVNLIPRFFDPQTGGVCIDGQDIRSVQVKSLREQIGLVPQDTLLFGGTVRENILYGKLDATEDELIEPRARPTPTISSRN